MRGVLTISVSLSILHYDLRSIDLDYFLGLWVVGAIVFISVFLL